MPFAATDSRLATIRGLLAKAEATSFGPEADAFMAKATKLMSRYAIDEALLWAVGEQRTEVPTELVIELRRPYLPQKAVLVNTVAEAFGSRCVRFLGGRGQTVEQVRVVGFPSDLGLVETLVTSLLVQLGAAMLSGQPSGLTASGAAAWRRSFIMGFADVIASRLASQRDTMVAGAGCPGGPPGVTPAGVAVALRDRSLSVAEELKRRHPRLSASRVSSGSSAHGRRSGGTAAAAADLGASRLRAQRALTA